MPFDTSIYGQIKQPEVQNPLNALAQFAAVQQAQNTNRLADLTFAQHQRSLDSDNALAGLLSKGLKPEEVATGLASQGYGNKSLEYAKQQQELVNKQADAEKDRATAKKTSLEAANIALTQHRAMLNNVNDPQSGMQWLVAGYQNPDTKPIFERFGPVDEALKRFQASVTDPASFAKWKQGASMNADELIKYTTPDANTVANNKQSDTNSQRTAASSKYATDSAARTAANTLSAGMSTPEYKQGEDGNWYALPKKVAPGAGISAAPVMGPDGKPLGAGSKLTESQGKATGFAARMESADKTINGLISQGTKTPSLIKQGLDSVPLIGGTLGSAANKFAASPDQQRMEQAQRDFVNAVLRQESGASISPSEFDNAAKQYFPQPGDSPAVIQQKAQNRAIAVSSMKTQAGPGAKSIPDILKTGGQSGAKPSLSDIFGH